MNHNCNRVLFSTVHCYLTKLFYQTFPFLSFLDNFTKLASILSSSSETNFEMLSVLQKSMQIFLYEARISAFCYHCMLPVLAVSFTFMQIDIPIVMLLSGTLVISGRDDQKLVITPFMRNKSLYLLVTSQQLWLLWTNEANTNY